MIECYLDKCPHHSIHDKKDPDVGPICYLEECAWDAESIKQYFNTFDINNPTRPGEKDA